jgi:hypothetical protein
MPATEAQIAANRANAARSTGPKTEDGKARSRGNALKHGLTGDGVVLPDADAAEVERLSRAFRSEMKAPGEAGQILAHRMAVLAVRMDRSSDQAMATLAERARQAREDFEAPEGLDADQVERLRASAAARAMFDPSKEATLARKYEAAAERGFYRALKELRQLKKESSPGQDQVSSPASVVAAEARSSMARLGSFLQGEMPARPVSAPPVPTPRPTPSKPLPVASKGSMAAWDPFAPTSPTAFDVPIMIGRAR